MRLNLLIALALMILGPTWAASADEIRPSSQKPKVIFIGSSSIAMWDSIAQDFPEVETVNLGVGGTQYDFLIEHAGLWMTAYNPDGVVIYSGDNDITAGKTPEAVAANFKTTVQIISAKKPSTKIYVLSIKPSPAPDRRRELDDMRAANRMIKEISKEFPNVTFVDVYSKMLDPSGEPNGKLFIKDGVHLNDKGYDVWESALDPCLDSLSALQSHHSSSERAADSTVRGTLK